MPDQPTPPPTEKPDQAPPLPTPSPSVFSITRVKEGDASVALTEGKRDTHATDATNDATPAHQSSDD